MRVLVREGQLVKRGQVLVRIDPNAYRRDAYRAKASLDEAEALLRTTPTRAEDQSAQSTVALARARLTEALLNLERTDISAPMPGHVAKEAVGVGQVVQPGQELMVLEGCENTVIANITETQIARVHPGQKVEVWVRGQWTALSGRVESIAPATAARLGLMSPEDAVADLGKRTQRIPVTITLDPSAAGSALRHGTHVKVRILPTE